MKAMDERLTNDIVAVSKKLDNLDEKVGVLVEDRTLAKLGVESLVVREAHCILQSQKPREEEPTVTLLET